MPFPKGDPEWAPAPSSPHCLELGSFSDQAIAKFKLGHRARKQVTTPRRMETEQRPERMRTKLASTLGHKRR